MKKYEFNRWKPFQYDALQAHLEKRAEEGWLLERIIFCFLIYRKAEPGPRRYELAYHPDRSNFEPDTVESRLRYRDYCRQAGWEYITDWDIFAQIEVYANDRPNPVPIQSDERVRWSVLGDWMERRYGKQRKGLLWGNLALALFYLLYAGTWMYQRGPEARMLAGAALMVLLVLISAGAVWYCRWWLGRARAAEEGTGPGPDRRIPLWIRAALWAELAAVLPLYFLLSSLSYGVLFTDELRSALRFVRILLVGPLLTPIYFGMRRRNVPEAVNTVLSVALVMGYMVLTEELLKLL